MNTKILFITLLIICFASCIPSLHPIFTDKSRSIDDRIVGEWTSSGSKSKQIDVDIEVPVSNKITKLLKSSLKNKTQEKVYRFERSSTLTYEKVENENTSNKSTIKLPLQRENLPKKSLIDKGYQITNIEEDPFYILTYSEMEDNELITDIMIVNLTKIGSNLYMDFQNHEDFQKPSRFQTNMIPAHTFAKVEFDNGQLTIRSFDSEYIKKLIKNRKVRLKHETVDESIILTASTDDLRAFILKYGDDDKLFLESDYLTAL